MGDNELLLLQRGPKELFDPLAKKGLRPLLWSVNTELTAAATITNEIRRCSLKKLFLSDYLAENEELKKLKKAYGAAHPN